MSEQPWDWVDRWVWPWVQARARAFEDPGNYDALKRHIHDLFSFDIPDEPPPDLPGIWHHGDWGQGQNNTAGGRDNPGQTPGPPDAYRTGGTIMAGFADLSDDTINCIWSKRGDIANAYLGWETTTPAQKRGALSDWWSYTAEAQGKTPAQFAQGLGCMAGGGGTPPGGALPSFNLTGIVNWAKANPIPAIAGTYLLISLLRGR